MEYGCGFCGGTGKDPYHLLSKLATCQVCSGRKKVVIEGNAIRCSFCRGNGRQKLDSRVTCLACKGRGMVVVSNPQKCAACKGSGRTKESKLTCLKCHGYGFIDKI